MREPTQRRAHILANNVTGTLVRILLVRHGETVSNVEGRWQGQGDSPLTERGRSQAAQLAAALAQEPIAAVYSSDLGRALATARLVAAPHGLTVHADPRLREIHVGQWTGLSRQEIRDRFGGMLEAWAQRPATLRLPDGETLHEAQARALGFFEDVLGKHTGSTVVVVAHGAIGQAILVEGMGRTIEDLWLKERLDNCQISRLEWTPSNGLKLIELSDVKHLEDVGSLRGWRTTDDGEDAA
jgi:broad specificity phosphatase PhoE